MTNSYARAGVLSASDMPAFASGLDVLRQTFAFPRRGRPATDFGLYAAVLDLGNNQGLAISTDGVGTKLLVAEQMGKFDTVGIDCVAMNANDIVCVGAEPIAMVDYIAVQRADTDQLAELMIGLREGARLARISIPAGEVAQVPEMLKGDGDGFDLVGTCVGLVPMDAVITGKAIEAGDRLIGFASSGIHSNGFSLARRVFSDAGYEVGGYVEDFERTLGEELLEPTRMYVDLALALIEETPVHFLAHITGDGFLNLARAESSLGFRVESLPEVPAIFQLIQRLGLVPIEEMYRTYNMGVGFCAVVPEDGAADALEIARTRGIEAWDLGAAAEVPGGGVVLEPLALASTKERFVPLEA